MGRCLLRADRGLRTTHRRLGEGVEAQASWPLLFKEEQMNKYYMDGVGYKTASHLISDFLSRYYLGEKPIAYDTLGHKAIWVLE